MPLHRASLSASSNTQVNSLDIPVSGAVQESDLLLLSILWRTNATLNAPAGWTEIHTYTSLTLRQALYYRWAGASEPTSYTITTTGAASNMVGSIGIFYDVDPIAPINADNYQFNSSTNTCIAPSVTTTTDNCLLVFVAGIRSLATITVPDPAMIARWTQQSSDLSNPNVTGTGETQGNIATGATGTRQCDFSGAAANSVGSMVALAPVAFSTPTVTHATPGRYAGGRDAGYEVFIYDPAGTLLEIITDFESLSLARRCGEVGYITLTLSTEHSLSLFHIDGQIAVWRTPQGGNRYLEGFTTFLIRQIEWHIPGGREQEMLVIEGPDATDILARRIIAYATDTSYGNKSGAADDIMKAIIRENLGNLATDTDRDLSGLLTIDADTTLGPTVNTTFAWRNVLDILRDLTDMAYEAGTWLTWDLLTTTIPGFRFATFIEQRGVDHRFPGGSPPLLIGPQYGNLVDVHLIHDYQKEINYVYVGGQGEGVERVIRERENATRSAASAYNRREQFIDSRQTAEANTTQLDDEGDAALLAGQPLILVSGKLIDTPTATYGIDYHFGDYLTVQLPDGTQIDCRLEAYSLEVKGRVETIRASLVKSM